MLVFTFYLAAREHTVAFDKKEQCFKTALLSEKTMRDSNEFSTFLSTKTENQLSTMMLSGVHH